MSLPDIDAQPDSVVSVPLFIDNLQAREVGAFQFDILYDADVIAPASPSATVTGTMSEDLSVLTNSPAPGVLRVAVYGPVSVCGDGVYLDLMFKTKNVAGKGSALRLDRFYLNSDSSNIETREGHIFILSPSLYQ